MMYKENYVETVIVVVSLIYDVLNKKLLECLDFLNKEVSGIIPLLAAGTEETIKSGIFSIVVIVMVECAEGSSDTENANGWQIIIFTLIT